MICFSRWWSARRPCRRTCRGWTDIASVATPGSHRDSDGARRLAPEHGRRLVHVSRLTVGAKARPEGSSRPQGVRSDPLLSWVGAQFPPKRPRALTAMRPARLAQPRFGVIRPMDAPPTRDHRRQSGLARHQIRALDGLLRRLSPNAGWQPAVLSFRCSPSL